ncbi:hypothetical protein SAMN05443252_104306 [Bacillus sp. OV322]|uniref:hypothetical protein n=1 Tax=Bacillus sp. OV322 TaxID=1882764 RepID=UPI0008E4601D|nr:hypothetical protein [Bacillus sp. OV322]SFC55951.1 hypothetical protein SAMN05443252_104306 [Bacillus sp. OV322]
MCGIDFVIGVTDKEASKAEKHVHFNDERIHDYLLTMEKSAGKECKLLLNLDRFSQTIIYTKDVPELKAICEELLRKYKNSEKEQEIGYFAKELIELCEAAINQKKHIYAIGD